MQTCRPQRPRALQPHGKCENGSRCGPYVLATARWPWQIVQDMRACRRRATRHKARRIAEPSTQAAMPTRLATARQARTRFTMWALRLGGHALALADRPRKASTSPARDAPRGAENRGAKHADSQAAVPTRLATARQVRKTVHDVGTTSWRPRDGLGRSSKTREHVGGARRATRHGESRSQARKPQCPRALQPRGKREHGLRCGPYVLAATRWPWQIVQEKRALRQRATRQGARRIAEPSMQTCRPQCPRAWRPHGKRENG